MSVNRIAEKQDKEEIMSSIEALWVRSKPKKVIKAPAAGERHSAVQILSGLASRAQANEAGMKKKENPDMVVVDLRST